MFIKSINTRYAGYLFRSRLEARWAVFFTKLGVEWEYEPEGFDIDGVKYLPDFRVMTPHGEPIWYEIKPRNVKTDPKFDAFEKALEAVTPDGAHRAALLSGDPLDVLLRWETCPRCGMFHEGNGWWFDFSDQYASSCYPCDAETPTGGGHPLERGFLGIEFYPHKGWQHVYKSAWNALLRETLIPAARAAREARFEFGAKP